MKKLKLLFSVLFLFLALTAPVQAQERILDYFYPEGRSSYYIYNDEKSGPVEKVNVTFERSSTGDRLDRESPIPLIGSIKFLPYSQAAHVHHQYGRKGKKIQHIIPVAYRVHAVGIYIFKI